MDIGNVIAAVVVLAVLGAVFGFILAVASKVFEVCLLYTSPSPRD